MTEISNTPSEPIAQYEPAEAFDDELAECDEGAQLLLKGLLAGAIVAAVTIATAVLVIINKR